MDGALMEVGPYRLKDNTTLEYNEGSWDEFANLLFIDQPVGTGFSYVNGDQYIHELDDMANHFITFLEKWFALFPEYELDDVCKPSPFSPTPALCSILTKRERSISPENHMRVSTSHTLLKRSKRETKKQTDKPHGTSEDLLSAMAGFLPQNSIRPT